MTSGRGCERRRLSLSFAAMALDLRGAATIAACEFRCLLRDRHTLVYSILLPVLLYPALFIGAAQALAISRGAQERRLCRVAITGEPLGLRDFLARWPDSPPRPRSGLELVTIPPGTSVNDAEEIGSLIRKRTVDALVDLYPDPEGAGWRAVIAYNGSIEASAAARDRLEKALEDYREDRMRAAARARGAGEEVLDALRLHFQDLTPVERFVREVLARIAPILLVMMTSLGAFYPALDATVGERERGTIETALLTPVGRGTLVLGKYVPVAALSLLSAFLNFASMVAALWVFLFQTRLSLQPSGLPLGALAIAFAGAAFLAATLSAAMMAVALLARSFKEGQSYLGTILLLTMVPGLVAVIPEVVLTPWLASLPVVNLALAVRDGLLGKLDVSMAVLVLLASILHAALAMALSARLAARETVLLGSPAAPAGRSLLGRLLGRTA